MAEPVTVACVLRAGNGYGAGRVRALHRDVRRFFPDLKRFVCLTDTQIGDEGVTDIPLKTSWPGWWSKVELFGPETFRAGERVLYLDLDTVVAGDLTEIAARPEPFLVLADFYRQPPRQAETNYGSGLMMWTAPKLAVVYETFRAACTSVMGQMGARGDQGFIESMVPGAAFWQRTVPGQVVSYKVHCRNRRDLPPGARVVCFHGFPRPWESFLAQRHPWLRSRTFR